MYTQMFIHIILWTWRQSLATCLARYPPRSGCDTPPKRCDAYKQAGSNIGQNKINNSEIQGRPRK